MDTPFRHTWIVKYIFPLIGGMLYATSFPMTFAPSFFLGTTLGMSLLLYALPTSKKELEESTLLKEVLIVICFCIGYNLLGYYWIPETLKEFGEIAFPFNWMLGVFFSLIICPHLLIFAIGHRFYKNLSVKTSIFVATASSRNIVYAFFLTLLEYCTPQQFPAHMGHSWLNIAPNLGLAPIFGAPFFSFLNFWLALAIVSKIKFKKRDILAPITFIIILAINIALPLKPVEKIDYSHNIRLVQPNIGNFLKISSEKGVGNTFQTVYERYYRLSTKESRKAIDLIVFPETAYPKLLRSEKMRTDERYTPKLMRSIIYDMGAELFTGGYDRSEKQNDYFFETEYNTAFHFGKDAKLKEVFHKVKLIPFGEGLPFGPLNEFFSKIIKNISFFASGEKFTLFKTNKETPFTSAICYEILFSNFLRNHINDLKEEPQFLINLTNDSWYGVTAEPEQHLFLSKWRALEFNLPIIRMTNTGITSVIYPDGSESERSKLFVEEVQDIEFNISKRERTPFQRFGLLPMILFAISILGISIGIYKTTSSKN